MKRIHTAAASFICYLFLIICSLISQSGCASKSQTLLLYPDLAILSVKQYPSIAAEGRQIHFTIEIANIGESIAPSTIFRLSDSTGKTITEKPIAALHPKVNLAFTLDLPRKVKSGNYILSIDPEKKIYERVKINNTLTVGIRFVSLDELKKIDTASEEEFLAEMKKNNANECSSKIIIRSFTRMDKTMNFETAYSGETVKLKVEIENLCDCDVYDLLLDWIQRESGDPNAAEKIFGQVTIDKLIPGEKRILYRTLTPSAGKWRINLKLTSTHASNDREVYLEPSFILIVRPEE